MPKIDRCPICNVSVRSENLLKHLNDIHPRHPDIQSIRDRMKDEGRLVAARRGGPPLRVRRWQLLALGVVVLLVLGGIVAAPYLDPNRNFSRDSCISSEPFHLHPFLRINILGNDYPIPANIGIGPNCTKPLHTHSGYNPASGFVQIHVEGPVARDFSLGDFFYVWGQPFSSTQILSNVDDGTNHVTMRVDGNPSTSYGSLILRDGQQIEIFYGP